jgi:hypothetical protein
MILKDLNFEELGICGYANTEVRNVQPIDFIQLKQMQNLKWSKEACQHGWLILQNNGQSKDPKKIQK